jgi:hypothetical protein
MEQVFVAEQWLTSHDVEMDVDLKRNENVLTEHGGEKLPQLPVTPGCIDSAGEWLALLSRLVYSLIAHGEPRTRCGKEFSLEAVFREAAFLLSAPSTSETSALACWGRYRFKSFEDWPLGGAMPPRGFSQEGHFEI